jgi:hypothetical protein
VPEHSGAPGNRRQAISIADRLAHWCDYVNGVATLGEGVVVSGDGSLD